MANLKILTHLEYNANLWRCGRLHVSVIEIFQSVKFALYTGFVFIAIRVISMESLSNQNIPQQWSIFSVLYEVIKERELKKLRFAKCSNCQLFTPYRLKSLGNNELKCKKCGLTIQLVREG
ncbi:MAG: hypothetical protein QXN87_02845 [Candidatus Bathyarchaeia archaeon]